MHLPYHLLLCTILCVCTLAQAGTPRLSRLTPPGGQRGTTVEVYFTGRYLEEPREVLFYEQGIAVESIEPLSGEVLVAGRRGRVEPGMQVRVRLRLADDCPLGSHGMRLRTAFGVSDYQRFSVGPFPTVDEDEQPPLRRNDKRETAKAVQLDTTVHGRMNDPTDVDLYQITAKRGQRISAEIEAARLGVERGVPDLHLTILDSQGKTLMEADDSALFLQDPVASLVAERDGTHYIQVRHSIYNAANEVYRLHVGSFSRPTALYPAGGEAGSKLSVRVLGDPRGAWATSVHLPTRAGRFSNPSETSTSASASTTTSATDGLEGRPAESGDFPVTVTEADAKSPAPTPNKLRVSPFGNVLEAEPNDSPETLASAEPVELPIAFNGIIEKAGDVDCFRFRAKKGERFRIHALANALGSPVDPTIWVRPLAAKSAAGTVRATDSRPNQLGIPPSGGLNRDTLDPVLEFAAPADGEYVLGVEDDRGAGGNDYVYRVECQRETDAVYTYLPPEPENIFTPQMRQVIAVPAGNRYNTQVAIFSTNRPFSGDLEVAALGLPEGVTMHAPRLTPGMTRVPVVFEAAAGVKPQAAMIDLVVRPARNPASNPASGGRKPPGNAAVPTRPVSEHVENVLHDTLRSGYRQVVPMNQYGNNDFYLHTVVDKLAVVVTEPAPFSIQVQEPPAALVQNGEMPIKFSIRRAEGFDGPVTVSMEWRPTGVNAATPITIRTGETEGEYTIGAARNSVAGSYTVTLTAVSGGERPGYYDNANRTYVAAQPFKLTVAEPHIEARFARTSIERGKTAEVKCRLNHLKPFEGKAKATLARLPRGVELVGPPRELTAEDKEISFTLRATEDCLVGSYQGITLDLTVIDDGQSVRQLSGFGTLRIDPPRGTKSTK
jgi:hypothetical protein